jgi:hypothetical protein
MTTLSGYDWRCSKSLDFFQNRSERPEIEPRSAGCSRGFREHAPCLRNGLRVQAQTRPARVRIGVAGVSGSMLPACEAVCVCKRKRALQGR